MRERDTDGAVELTRAGPEHEPVLANLLSLYIHDLSEFIDLQPQPDGRFDYPWLALYWQERDRIPFLVRVDGRSAGFVLIRRALSVLGEHEVWDMAEFFILRGFRGRGIGAAVANEVWRRFPGRWEVRVRDTNRPALEFWTRTVSAFTGSPATAEDVQEGEKRWHTFAFASAGS